MEQQYIVRGSWPFPLDMLRHDDSKAATAEDQSTIDRLSGDHVNNREDFQPVAIKLIREAAHKWSSPNIKRWESFGWSVVPESLAEHLRPVVGNFPIDPIIEVRHKGKTITVRGDDDTYTVFVDGVVRHPGCDGTAVMRALATYLHDDS